LNGWPTNLCCSGIIIKYKGIFLTLLKEKQIADLMDSKRYRTSDIFKSLENDMNKNGIMRDAKQIQISRLQDTIICL